MTMKIIVDKREKNSLVPHELLNLGAKIEFQRLPVADYLIRNVAIERKTANDFINSMINKRLMRQLQELKQFKKSLLIIEGDPYKTRFNHLNQRAIRGMLLSIILDYNIPIVFTSDYDETAEYLISLVKRIKRGKNDVGLRAKRKIYNMAEQQQMIIEGLPSIGPTLARALLKKFKTIKALVNASEKELCQVEKIGKEKARIIKNILEEPYLPRY
ncbi:hypothetical protein B6U80_01840 [Candidatus Pacearchaeota archaeon ex4484_26]|nr:MAG: hypothetical protein B6U80_01840 [Candidatus Pacearchaeota archaeon ex4484_26]RLG13194.1 MAG: hypothetical protein DRN69_06080 [Candidatus Pacearchaeota archaeon]